VNLGEAKDRRERCAILGFGRIGRLIAERLARNPTGPELVAVLAKPGDACGGDVGGARICASLDNVLSEMPAIVVECASAMALAAHAPVILAAGIDLAPLSLAALADPATERRICAAAVRGPGRIEIPSGAAGAIGLVAAAKEAGLSRVLFRQSYPPLLCQTLLADEAGGFDRLSEPRIIFRGSAREGSTRFPRNLNAATGVALAGLGLERTLVEFVADPGIAAPAYALEIEAAQGPIRLTIGSPAVEAAPDYTAFTVLALLRRRTARIAS
jgi:aspartate dehydrogenase